MDTPLSLEPSLQDRFAAGMRCFGCGPANEKGLRLKSRPLGEDVVAEWTPEPHHEAYPGAVNGGVIGALFDCHSNWTAAWHMMRRDGLEAPPCTVTAEFHVKLRRPTPSSGVLRLSARPVESGPDRVVVEARLEVGDRITATCRGTFVAVKEGHPAFHRW